MEVISNSTSETKELAGRVAAETSAGDVYALYGDLGSGKTTFTRYFVEALGISARVQSPTFVIMRHYKDVNIPTEITHIDLYRLTSIEEVKDIGLEEIVTKPNNITLIEWPEIAEDILPSKTKKIYFEDKGENTKCIKY